MFFYRLLYTFAKCLIILIKPILGDNLKKWIELRSAKFEKSKQLKATYWFHASSGEIEYCKSIIRLLKEKSPQSTIVVTYSSPSAEKLFKNIDAYVTQFIPLCWDQPKPIQELMDYINPEIIIFSRTDLWPELIFQAKKRNIKTAIVSYLPKFSLLNRIMNNFLLPQFNFVSCIDAASAQKLQNTFSGLKVTADGDTRYDQVFFRLANKPILSFKKTEFKVFICGSTWEQDEDVLLPTFEKLKEYQFKIILSPHEVNPSAITKIENKLTSIGLSYTRLSQTIDLDHISIQSDVFIIDKIGYLADCYRFADCAFIGGSFKDKIHSVMEALCCGLPVICGPFYQNNPEAVKYNKSFVFPVENSTGLLSAILDTQKLQKIDILNELKQNQNASKKVLDHLLSLN